MFKKFGILQKCCTNAVILSVKKFAERRIRRNNGGIYISISRGYVTI
jgi:hypothetical protein